MESKYRKPELGEPTYEDDRITGDRTSYSDDRNNKVSKVYLWLFIAMVILNFGILTYFLKD